MALTGEMGMVSVCCNNWMSPSAVLPIHYSHSNLYLTAPRRSKQQSRRNPFTAFTSKSPDFSLNSFMKRCEKCGGKGAIECPGCKGTGKNKKNGNIFERWKCFDCQGFGLRSCPSCGKGGLTPEQRGER